MVVGASPPLKWCPKGLFFRILAQTVPGSPGHPKGRKNFFFLGSRGIRITFVCPKTPCQARDMTPASRRLSGKSAFLGTPRGTDIWSPNAKKFYAPIFIPMGPSFRKTICFAPIWCDW